MMIRLNGAYTLRTNAATLVTANCSSARVIAPGQSCREVRQRIRRSFQGEERRRRLRGLRETFSFSANMTGRIIQNQVVATT